MSGSVLTHAVYDGVVFSPADLELRSCSQQARAIHHPAHQEHPFGTEHVHISDMRLWEPPNCNETQVIVKRAGFETNSMREFQ